MTLQRKIGFWLLALGVFGVAVWVLREILLPFIAGLILAYLLDPLVDRLERLGLGRVWATLAILVLSVLAFLSILFLLVPLFGSQVLALAERLPEYAKRLQSLVAEQGGPLLARLGGPQIVADLQQSLGNVVGQGARVFAGFIGSLWSGGQALLGVFSLVVVTPVVAFYLLVDWDKMIATVDSWVPVDQRETVRGLCHEIDMAIAGFLRGQALVCLLLGAFYAVALSAIGLNFGFIIGASAGLLSFIPYVGSLTGLVLSVGVAIVQFWPEWTWIVVTLIIFAVGQFVEGNILAPKLVGESVGLHPVWLMFALFAFGTFFGFVGLLLAVPLAAAVGVLVRFGLRQYLASPLHLGSAALRPGAE
jgi:predicted PurR-regulated permease PerM